MSGPATGFHSAAWSETAARPEHNLPVICSLAMLSNVVREVR